MRMLCGVALAAAVVVLGAASATAGVPAAATTPAPTASTTAMTTTTTTGSPAAPIPRAQSLDRGCVVGSIALLLPHRTPLLIGPAARSPATSEAASSALVYPADGSVVSAAEIETHTSGCGSGGAAAGQARLSTLSLFGGAVTAAAVGLTLGDTGSRHTETLEGFEVNGRLVPAPTGARIPIAAWGYLQSGVLERFRAPASGGGAAPARVQATGLTIHLLQAHAGLPAGTQVLIAFAALPGPVAVAAPAPGAASTTSAAPADARPPSARTAHAGKKKRHVPVQTHEPLAATPALGLSGYVFPVAGSSSFVDTYGAFRGDVPGNWHHGDDIFAALGTPVVAVADGTVRRVGWERIGGWRLWVKDARGNRFYYAHLSGYAPAVMGAADGGKVEVRAGEVLGFVGNSGDAFTTSPHLHFEVHPRRFAYLGYDGAVDPTGYLEGWRRLGHVAAPRPVHPPDPAGAPGREARYIWRELLAARGLSHRTPLLRERPRIAVPSGDTALRQRRSAVAAGSVAAAVAPPRASGSQLPLIVATALAAVALLGVAAVGLLRPVSRPVSADAAAPVEVPAAPSAGRTDPLNTPPAPPRAARRPQAATVMGDGGRGAAGPVLAAGSIAAVSVGAYAARKRMRRR